MAGPAPAAMVVRSGDWDRLSAVMHEVIRAHGQLEIHCNRLPSRAAGMQLVYLQVNALSGVINGKPEEVLYGAVALAAAAIKMAVDLCSDALTRPDEGRSNTGGDEPMEERDDPKTCTGTEEKQPETEPTQEGAPETAGAEGAVTEGQGEESAAGAKEDGATEETE